MNARKERSRIDEGGLRSGAAFPVRGTGEARSPFTDNRPETIAQRKLQEMADGSPQVRQLESLRGVPGGTTAQRIGLLGIGALGAGAYALYRAWRYMFPAVTVNLPDDNVDVWEGYRDFAETGSVKSKFSSLTDWLSLEVRLGGNDLGLTEMFVKSVMGGGWVDVDTLSAQQLGAYSMMSRFKIVIHIGPALLRDEPDTARARVTSTLHHEWSSHGLPFYNFAVAFGRTLTTAGRTQLAQQAFGHGGSLDVDEQHDRLASGHAENYRTGMNESSEMIRRRNPHQGDELEIDGLGDQLDHLRL